MLFRPGSLSVIACPAQRQSAEAVRRVREMILKAAGECEFKKDNVYELELANGSRVLALPGTHDSIRGLTVDGWIVADEAAQLSDDLIVALHPMRARRPQARIAMLSTAWTRTDPFWKAWSDQDQEWIRLEATLDTGACQHLDPKWLEQQRRTLGEADFNREYRGKPTGAQASPFTLELYELATRLRQPLVAPGPALCPPGHGSAVVAGGDSRGFHPDDPRTWPVCQPYIIAHDVGRSRDRSTAVVGGKAPFGLDRCGITELFELEQGLVGSARASALAEVDRRYGCNALIVADLSNDPSYAEVLLKTFGPRVIGVHITASGDGSCFERRPVGHGIMLVYTVGRSYLLERFQPAPPRSAAAAARCRTGAGPRRSRHSARTSFPPCTGGADRAGRLKG
jgi:Terminase large subunit, T4likevirus-type, N-terminal